MRGDEAHQHPRPAPNDQLVLAWEFFDGKKWRHLGRTNPRGMLPGAGDEFGFHDDTRALSQSGAVTFRRPKDMENLDINGEVKRWVRCRIEKGDYGETGTYTLENDKWILKDDRALRLAGRQRPGQRPIGARQGCAVFADRHRRGLAGIVQAQRFAFDPREQALGRRIERLAPALRIEDHDPLAERREDLSELRLAVAQGVLGTATLRDVGVQQHRAAAAGFQCGDAELEPALLPGRMAGVLHREAGKLAGDHRADPVDDPLHLAIRPGDRAGADIEIVGADPQAGLRPVRLTRLVRRWR